jgi:hypothetical protein
MAIVKPGHFLRSRIAVHMQNMNTVRVATTVLATLLIFSIELSDRVAAQNSFRLPESAFLSDVQIEWQSGGGDGCAGDCTDYRIVLRADGFVSLEDLGWGNKPPLATTLQRSMSSNIVIGLINQMFDARFMSPDSFQGVPVAVRKGESLFFYGMANGSGPWVDLSLRVGTTVKTRRLGDKAPADLLRVKDRIWEIAGPKTWPAQ